MPDVVVRTLKREYRLACPSDEIADALAFMRIAPDVIGIHLTPVTIPIVADQGFLRMDLPSGDRIEGTPLHLMAVLHRVILDDVTDSEPDCPIVHTATFVDPAEPDKRLLVIGHKEAGKTTLGLKLSSEGFEIEGDEHLLVRAGEVVARPRTLRIKSGTLELMPDLAPQIMAHPFVTAWEGHRIYAVPPNICGSSWRIRAGSVSHIIFLEANHGGRSSLKSISREEAFRRLLVEALLPDSSIGAAAARLRMLVCAAHTHRLLLGDLDQAVWLIRRAVFKRREQRPIAG